MATAARTVILNHLRGLVGPHSYERASDRDLLRRFAEQRDEAAFAALVRRHSAMVLGVALRALRQRQDALLRFAFHQRIIDLEEIELLASHQFFDFAQGSGLVVGNPHVPDAPLLFPFMERCELCIHINEIMHLH